MSSLASIDPTTSALVLMDFQCFVLENFVTRVSAANAVDAAGRLLHAWRAMNKLAIHVTVGFRPGFPEIDPRSELFSSLRNSGLIDPGSDGLKIHTALTPLEFEPVITKHRVGPFVGTDLERVLRAQGIETLILCGVTTAGVVLSTVRQAVDLDYEVVIVRDACADADEDIHTFLMEKVLAPHAKIVSVEEVEKVTRACREFAR